MFQQQPVIQIQAAVPQLHPELSRIARTSRYTSDFTNRIMFSSDVTYARGWIVAALIGGKPVGFYCVRHKSRSPETVLYFLTVSPECRSTGVGAALMADLKARSPHGRVVLNVAKENVRAHQFYFREGFIEMGESLNGTALKLGWSRLP